MSGGNKTITKWIKKGATTSLQDPVEGGTGRRNAVRECLMEGSMPLIAKDSSVSRAVQVMWGSDVHRVLLVNDGEVKVLAFLTQKAYSIFAKDRDLWTKDGVNYLVRIEDFHFSTVLQSAANRCAHLHRTRPIASPLCTHLASQPHIVSIFSYLIVSYYIISRPLQHTTTIETADLHISFALGITLITINHLHYLHHLSPSPSSPHLKPKSKT